MEKYQIRNLQRVMNATARLVYCASKYCHITSLLRELDWLPSHQNEISGSVGSDNTTNIVLPGAPLLFISMLKQYIRFHFC